MSTRRRLDAALEGCTIVIAADRRAGDLSSALERRGARVYRAPALSIVPNADDERLVSVTRELIRAPPDTVVVTTGVGFRGWMDAAHENGLAEQLHAAFVRTRFVARGPKAHGAIQQAGFTADWVAESETAAEVGEYLLSASVTGDRIAVQHHGAGSDGLDELLRAQGAEVTSLTVYRWGPPPDEQVVQRSALLAASGEVDAVLFTSAPGARAWIRFAERAGALVEIRRRAQSGRLLLAAVGPLTAVPLNEAVLGASIAERARLGSLVRLTIGYFSETSRAPTHRTRAGMLSVRSGGAVLDGEFVPLSRAGAALLGVLFDAGDRVLSREEIAAGMPGPAQNAHAVEMAVARVREAFGATEIIKTVVKRGYRLAREEDI